MTLSLEDFKLQPGDVVSLYATAKDNHAEAKTDIALSRSIRLSGSFRSRSRAAVVAVAVVAADSRGIRRTLRGARRS